ncbi:MAG TPA: 7-cyano-7-deazaguanine synthase [Urbifossiella sp.]|nr:7-cyano-7-deazaguanine synthase [Urbifossiella sp.]
MRGRAMSRPRAVVLLSGGLDSTTTAAAAKADGFDVYALSVDYGQRHRVELARAAAVAAALGVAEHRTVAIDLRAIGGSALTADVAVPKDRSADDMGRGVPVTYVPARNTILLGLALGYAETVGAFDIFIGANVLDYSVHGDTRVWLRTREWARLMPIREVHALPPGEYETVAVDPATLRLGWFPVTARARHWTATRRAFEVRLDRGQTVTVSEDHSLFTLDPDAAAVVPVRGDQIAPGMPLVVPYDLSAAAGAWAADLPALDLAELPAACAARFTRRSIVRDGDFVTNRLHKTRLPVRFPVDDEFLYVVGLWLAEGGKEPGSRTPVLSFSVGGIPGAADRLTAYFARFGVNVHPSPANRFDFQVASSVFATLFWHLGLFGTAKAGRKRFPTFFWHLSQRQRRVVVAGLWDGDGSRVFKGRAVLTQKSHALIDDLYHVLLLDGIFPNLKRGPNAQKLLYLGRSRDFARFVELYPLAHPEKRADYFTAAARTARDKATGLWKCPGLWRAVAAAELPAGGKTAVYNRGGKYDASVRAQRSAFADVPALAALVRSPLAFCQVTAVRELPPVEHMYDLSVEGAETFVADGMLAHNSGYPDCRPEFLAAFEGVANLATKAGTEGAGRFRVQAPLLKLTKAEIIREGLRLGVDYAGTVSCYDPDAAGRACGRCDSCQLRRKGFAEAGAPDPTAYQPGSPGA